MRWWLTQIQQFLSLDIAMPVCVASLSQQILIGVCGSACLEYKGARGNAHPVCLFNARVASSWKLRKLVLFGALLAFEVRKPQGSYFRVIKPCVLWQHKSAFGATDNAACVTAPGVSTDDALTSQVPPGGEMSSTGDPPAKRVCLFRRVQRRETMKHLWIIQRTALWRTHPRGDPWNVLASGTTNYASCVTAMGVHADAAFMATDVSRGTARQNTCAPLRKPCGGEMARA